MTIREFDKKRLRFISGDAVASIDRSIFRSWSDGVTTTHNAMMRMAVNNNWKLELSDQGFIELAHSCGYWRIGQEPEWMRGNNK